jgi:hypothetical protein
MSKHHLLRVAATLAALLVSAGPAAVCAPIIALALLTSPAHATTLPVSVYYPDYQHGKMLPSEIPAVVDCVEHFSLAPTAAGGLTGIARLGWRNWSRRRTAHVS